MLIFTVTSRGIRDRDISATPTSGNLVPHTYVYDGNQNSLGDGSGDVSVSVTAGYTYYVAVAGVGLTAGKYVLQSPPITPLPPAPPSQNADWTFMVYMDGNNDLASAAITNFLQMASVGSNANVSIVVLFAREAGMAEGYGDWSGHAEGLVHEGDTPNAIWGTSVGNVNMGSPATLTNFVTWAAKFARRRTTALVLWDHGGGIYGVCEDDVHNDSILSLQESPAASAARRSPRRRSPPWGSWATTTA